MGSLIAIVMIVLVASMTVSVGSVFAEKVFHGVKEIEAIPALPNCNPGQSNPAPIYTEKDDNGNRIEIWCTNGQYLMKFIDSQGQVVYVGECYFDGGQNRIFKQVRYATVTILDNGTKIKTNSTIIRTWWHNFDPINMAGMINQRDLLWFFNPLNNTVIRFTTEHNGTWLNSTYYHVNGSKSVGPGKSFTAPKTPGGLLAFVAPSPSSGSMGMIPPDYAFATPVPVTGEEHGKMITATIVEPVSGGPPIVNLISARVGTPFLFDIEYPEESNGIEKYYLLEGPLGMTVGEQNGIIQWTPTSDEVGNQTVSLKILFADGTSDLESFVIPVSGESAVPVAAASSFPLWVIGIIVVAVAIAAALVFARKR